MARRWIMLLVTLGLLTSCRNPSMISDSNEVQTLKEKEKTVIQFWHTYNDKETELLEKVLIPAFEVQNPDIEVDSINFAFNNEFKYTLTALASSNRGPDVVRIDIAWVPEFSQKRLLEPLNKLPDFNEVQKRFHTNLMNVGLYNKNYYSIPLNIYMKAAIFNRKLLEHTGYSKPPTSMQEVIQLVREYNLPIGLGGLEPWHTFPYVQSLGGSLTDKNFTKASGYLNSPETIHSIEQLTDLYKKKLIKLPKKSNNGENLEGVKNGNLLMTDDGPWFYSLLNNYDLYQAERHTLPVQFPDNSGSPAILGGENLVMMKGSKQPEAAWIFIKWITDQQAQLTMAKTGLMPTNKEAARLNKVNQYSFLQPYKKMGEDATLLPPVKNWSKIEAVYTDYIGRIFAGELSVKDGLDRAALKIDKLLID